MLNIFTLANGRLFQEEIESLEELSRFQPIWVDLESPTLEEKRWVKQYYGLSIPEDAMDEDIEESARFYEEDNGDLHIRSDFLIADDERAAHGARGLHPEPGERRRSRAMACCSPSTTRTCRCSACCGCARAARPGLIEDAKEVLLKLFDADAEYSADTLEGIYDELEKVEQAGAGRRSDRHAGRRGAGRHRAPGRPERPHPPQRDGHAPRGELHDAQPHARRRASSRRRGRSCATSNRWTTTRPSCSTRSTS